MESNFSAIKCPHCGREYLANELFVNGEMLGKTKNVIRDAIGKILYVEWYKEQEPNFQEKYICDQCQKPFIVNAELSFKTKPEEEELDFSNTSVSLLD